MEQCPSWETNRFSVTREIPRILWNLKDLYRLQKDPPIDPILSLIKPAHTSPFHFLTIHFNITFSHTPGSSTWSPSLRFPHQKPCMHPPLPNAYYVPSPSNSSYLITWTIFSEQYTSLSSSSCSVLHSPGTSSLWGPNFIPCTLFSNTLRLRSSLCVSDHDSHPYKTTGNFIVLCISIVILLECKVAEW
jgi:hypothetical protein